MKKNKKKIINKDIILPEKNSEFNPDLDLEIDSLPEDEYDFIQDAEENEYKDFDSPPTPGERP